MNDTNGSPDSDDERRQRQMDFILEQQAQFSVDIQLLKETIVAHTEAINAQAAYSTAEFARTNERMNRFEQLLYGSLENQESLRESQRLLSQDVRLVTTSVNRIVETVAFLIEERKRNGNGS